MAKSRISLTHEHENTIVAYCAYNNIEFNQTNAYDETVNAFKDNPIKHKTTDDFTGEERSYNITSRIATLIERQPKTIDRIADKVERKKAEIQREIYDQNIAKAKESACPDIHKLVDNLYRLNLVDKNSYLALVCFLMQLKYSRDNEIAEDDKSCVFFNGVAHNGKSATAKAIMEVESQYGPVFKAHSVNLLSSNHEEHIWKSHLNYFDEARPSDIDREQLLNLINGGDFEINPKNKRQYVYHVNTNNIFTSNDAIYLRQRRVSVVKFGKRLSCRPLENGTLKQIIVNIMDALPDFEHYYDLYKVVSLNNENNVNSAAISDIMTYLHKYMGYVCDGNELSLCARAMLTTHSLYENIKCLHNKQLVAPERRDAIRDALDFLVQKELIDICKYDSSTTKYYQVSGKQYLKMRALFDIQNTKQEQIDKTTKVELYDCLVPFFTAKPDTSDQIQIEYPEPSEEDFIPEDDEMPYDEDNIATSWTKGRGGILAHNALISIAHSEEVSRFLNMNNGMNMDGINHILKTHITREFCQCVCYQPFLDKINRLGPTNFGDTFVPLVQNIYMDKLGITEGEKLDQYEADKLAEIKKINDSRTGQSPK